MLSIAAERQQLAKAGEERILRQERLVGELRADGRDASQAETLLDTMRQTLRSWHDHRDEILRTIARLEAGQLSPLPE